MVGKVMAKDKTTNIIQDMACIALFLEDSTWYNTKVLEVREDNMYRVLYTDYGNEEVVDCQEIVTDFRDIKLGALVNPLVHDNWNKSEGIITEPEEEDSMVDFTEAEGREELVCVRKARCWYDIQMLKLKIAAEGITELATAYTDDGWDPDATHLDRKVSALKASWVSFELGHQNLYGLVTTDQEIAEVRETFKRQLASYSETLEMGESLQASLRAARPSPLTLKERLDYCLLASVFAILRTDAASPGRAILQCSSTGQVQCSYSLN